MNRLKPHYIRAGSLMLLLIALVGCASQPPVVAPTSASITKESIPRATEQPSTPTAAPLPSSIPQNPSIIGTETVANIVELGHWGRRASDKIVWSPDSRWLLGGSENGVYLFDATTFQEVASIEAPEDIGINDFDLNSNLTALALGDGRVLLYDTSSTKQVMSIKAHRGGVIGSALTGDGQLLGTAGTDGRVRVWRVSDGTMLQDYAGVQIDLQGVSFHRADLAFSADGTLLVAALGDGAIYVWHVPDSTEGQLLIDPENPGTHIVSVSLSADGQTVAATDISTIWIWNTKSGELLHRIEAMSVGDIALSPDKPVLAFSGILNSSIFLWHFNEDEEPRLFDVGETNNIVFSPDGTMLAASEQYRSISLWDLRTGDKLSSFADTTTISSLSFTPDSSNLAWNAGLSVRITRIPGGETERMLTADWIVDQVQYSSDGQALSATLIQSVSTSPTLLEWQLPNETAVRQPISGVEQLQAARFSPDRHILAVQPSNIDSPKTQIIELYDLQNHTLKHTLPIGQYVTTMSFSPDSEYMAVALSDQGVQIWRIQDGNLLATLATATSARRVTFAPDSRTVAIASFDGPIELWSVAQGTLLQSLPQAGTTPQSLAFSNDGSLLASGTMSGAIQLWDRTEGKLLTTLEGAQDSIDTLAFSPDGLFLASGGADAILRLWGIRQ